MGYKINGEVIISNSKDIDNVGIATMGLVDAKVSSKAITEQTEGSVSDVTGADEVLIYDAEGGSLLRVTVDEFISGSGIGTLVSDFDQLVVSGVTTTTDLHVNNILTSGITTIQDHLIVNDSNNAGTEYNFNVKTSGTSLFGVLGNGAVLLGNNSGAPFIATNDHHATSKKYVDDAISAGTTSLSDLNITGTTTVGFLTASNLYVSTGATVYGTLQAGIMTANWVSGNLQGVLYNSTGNPVLDPDGPGFGGTVYGNVISNVNTGFSTFHELMVSGMHTAGIITCDYIYGGFSGKIYNNQGNPILNSEDASFGGTVYGDLFGDVIAGSSGLSTFKDVNVTGVITATEFSGDVSATNVSASSSVTAADYYNTGTYYYGDTTDINALVRWKLGSSSNTTFSWLSETSTTKLNATQTVAIGPGIMSIVSVPGTSSKSVLLGANAAQNTTSMDNSVMIGYQAGNGETLAGGYGSYNQSVGCNENVFIGANAGRDVNIVTNSILIGYDAGLTGSPSGKVQSTSNVICLGDNRIQNLYCADTTISSSDARDKTDVQDFTPGLSFVTGLRPVTYRWDKRTSYLEHPEESILDIVPDGTHKWDKLHVGFLAQEVEEVEKAHGYSNDKDDQLIVNLNEDDTSYGVKYERLVPVLVNAIKELKAEIEDLKSRL